jgi:tripartite-type tricarboxylate transporter receptor subunit TctC
MALHRYRLRATFAMLVLLAFAPLPSAVRAADPVADFYRGKQLRMIVGYGVGGGYDLYGRLVAEFLGKHIPGNPNIVVENMPGAGGFKAAEYIYTVAPKDGTVLGSVSQTLALDVATGIAGNIDVAKLNYLGRVTSEIDVGLGLPGSPFKSFDDARKQQIVVAGGSGTANAAVLPSALKQFAGAKFKLVQGYKGTSEMLLAAERKEVDLVGGIGIPELLVSHPDWILKRTAVILYQNALTRSPLLKDVPTLAELGVTPEGKAVLRALASTAEVGRSILTTPDVPAERLKALRAAFAAMLADADFKAAVKKRNIEVDPATPERIDAIVKETKKLSPSVLAAVKALEE